VKQLVLKLTPGRALGVRPLDLVVQVLVLVDERK
jgi:hypothetical protein